MNGQAPPGARSLEDVGRWRCGGCNAWNGKAKPKRDSVSELVQSWEAERQAKEKELGRTTSMLVKDEQRDSAGEAEPSEGSGVDVAEEMEEALPPSRGTRSKSKAKGKK